MLWDYVKATFMIVMIIAAAYYVTKFVATKSAIPRGNMDIRIRSSVSLGRDRRLVIAEVGEKVYILGVTPQHIELVDQMQKDAFTVTETEDQPSPAPVDFRQELLKRLRGTFQDWEKK